MKHPMAIELTADGSHTIYLPEMDEHYHSVNGAMQESLHVFIEGALAQCSQKEISVLELGFGTGLNALLTALDAESRDTKIHYTTLEKFPLPDTILSGLNYGGVHPGLFRAIHEAEWEVPVAVTPRFTLHKIRTDFRDYPFSGRHDVVYYDAFAPGKQPEVWTPELFFRIAEAMNPGGILTTYCAKGGVRRMMQAAGLTTERAPGPPGKREMLRARKKA